MCCIVDGKLEKIVRNCKILVIRNEEKQVVATLFNVSNVYLFSFFFFAGLGKSRELLGCGCAEFKIILCCTINENVLKYIKKEQIKIFSIRTTFNGIWPYCPILI